MIFPAKSKDFPTFTTCVISARLSPLVPVRPQPSKGASKFPSARKITSIQLRHHADFRNRITYSARIDTLAPAALTDYIHAQLDRAGLPRSTFTEDASALFLRVSEGTLRAVKNLCVGSLIEAVRDDCKTVDLKQVNAVLMQPHWRHNSYD